MTQDYFMRQLEVAARMLGHTLLQKPMEEIPLYDAYGMPLSSGLLYRRLLSFLAQKNVNEAENILFEALEQTPSPDLLKVGLAFYHRVGLWSNDELLAAKFSYEEILEGTAALCQLCGVDTPSTQADLFTTEEL